MRVGRLSVLCGLLLLPACSVLFDPSDLSAGSERNAGSDGGSGTNPECPTSNVTGHWAGGLLPTSGIFVLGTGATEGDLQQDCNVVTGSLSIVGCMENGNVAATIADDGGLEGTLTAGSTVMTIKASVTSTTILGQYTNAASQGCYFSTGTIKLDRK